MCDKEKDDRICYINSIIFDGEVTDVSTGRLLSFTVSLTKEYDDGRKSITVNVNVKAFGRIAKMLRGSIKKGVLVRIVGRIEGKKSLYIVVEHLEVLGRKEDA